MDWTVPVCRGIKALFQRACRELHRSVSSIQDLRTGGRWFYPRVRPVFLPRIDETHWYKIHSSVIAVRCCFSNSYVGKQPVASKEYCAECLLKELQKSMDRCIDHRDRTEITVKTAIYTIKSMKEHVSFLKRINSTFVDLENLQFLIG